MSHFNTGKITANNSGVVGYAKEGRFFPPKGFDLSFHHNRFIHVDSEKVDLVDHYFSSIYGDDWSAFFDKPVVIEDGKGNLRKLHGILGGRSIHDLSEWKFVGVSGVDGKNNYIIDDKEIF